MKPNRKSTPLQVNPAAPAIPKTDRAMDIFAALSLHPSRVPSKTSLKSEAEARKVEQDPWDTIPPPISKTPVTRARKAVEEEERGRKKEKRMSLGNMLRRK